VLEIGARSEHEGRGAVSDQAARLCQSKLTRAIHVTKPLRRRHAIYVGTNHNKESAARVAAAPDLNGGFRLAKSRSLQVFPALEIREKVFAEIGPAADSSDCGPDPSPGTSMKIVSQFRTRGDVIRLAPAALSRVALAAFGTWVDPV